VAACNNFNPCGRAEFDAGQQAIGSGIAAQEVFARDEHKLIARLARELLGEDGKACAVAQDYDKRTREHLRAATGPLPTPQ
jgi:hypothetical protein